jgi:hypothetical protein
MLKVQHPKRDHSGVHGLQTTIAPGTLTELLLLLLLFLLGFGATLLEASSGGPGTNSNSSKQQLQPEMALQGLGASGEIPSKASAKR